MGKTKNMRLRTRVWALAESMQKMVRPQSGLDKKKLPFGKGERLEKMAFALHFLRNWYQDRFTQQNVDEHNIYR